MVPTAQTYRVSRSGVLQRFFWNNAGFGKVKNLSVLDGVPHTFDVSQNTPLGTMLPFSYPATQTSIFTRENDTD